MRTLRLIFIGILTLVIIGCTGLSISKYQSDSWTPDRIKKVAILPIKNTGLTPNTARYLDAEITKMFKRSSLSLAVMTVPEAMKKMNAHNLADDWAEFIVNYNTSGIPDQQILNAAGKALKVDAVIQGEIVDLIHRDGSFVYGLAVTRVEVRYSMFDSGDAELLWQIQCVGEKRSCAACDAPPPDEVIGIIIKEISKNMPSI